MEPEGVMQYLQEHAAGLYSVPLNPAESLVLCFLRSFSYYLTASVV
jgi:hypothetical protein